MVWGGSMRALKALTILMGVLILGGTAVLGVVLARRMGTGAAAPVAVVLDGPACTRIAGIAASGDRLAVHLQGGGPDRLVLIDPHSGATTARVALAR
jgi:hypothetical protein